MFERSEEYLAKMTMDALDREVHIDAKIDIMWNKGKLRCWCQDTKTWVQFPRDLREKYDSFVADVVKAQRGQDQVFYRAYKGSIRRTKAGKVLA